MNINKSGNKKSTESKKSSGQNVIDKQGFRLNVGIIVINDKNQLLWAQRYNQQAWQFPQGGVQDNESLQDALYRELYEELGLKPENVEICDSTPTLLKYRLPPKLIRHEQKPLCIGQKQKWYLLKLISSDDTVNLGTSNKPEFDKWTWVSYWYPLRHVISFKREVYRKALLYFAQKLFPKCSHLSYPRAEHFTFWIRPDKKS